MFIDISTALAIAKANLGISTTDTSRDAELSVLLTQSAGVGGGVTYYRPYIVAAYVLPLWSAVSRGTLISADGAKWLAPEDFLPLIQSLLTLQESADCGCEVDPCWTVDNLRVRLTCGCAADDGSVAPLSLGATVI